MSVIIHICGMERSIEIGTVGFICLPQYIQGSSDKS